MGVAAMVNGSITGSVYLAWPKRKPPRHFAQGGRHGRSPQLPDTDRSLVCTAVLVSSEQVGRDQRGDGTLLDTCLVMWINEQGNGDQHSELCIPYVLAGGRGGRLKTGRYLRCDHASANDLFITLMHLMGFDDVHSFGMKELCSGPLTGPA